MKKLFTFFIVILTSISVAEENQATVSINVSNIDNDTGQIVAFLFSSSDGFPMDADKAIYTEVTPIENGTAIITLDSIDYGNYALLVIHDENMNNELNTNFIGKPTEQSWVSNDQRGGPFGGPNFDASAFQILTDSLTITAGFNY